MQLDETILKQSIAGEIVGDVSPYNSGSKDEIEAYLKRVVTELQDSKLIEVDAVFDHYGSGYASYVDCFCYRKDGSSTVKKRGLDWVEGVVVYLSRLAPVAVYGKDTRTKQDGSWSRSFLEPRRVGTLPNPEWSDVLYEVTGKLQKAGFKVLRRAEVTPMLPFETKIPTVLNNGGYSIFDALFYWED